MHTFASEKGFRDERRSKQDVRICSSAVVCSWQNRRCVTGWDGHLMRHHVVFLWYVTCYYANSTRLYRACGNRNKLDAAAWWHPERLHPVCLLHPGSLLRLSRGP